MFGSRKSDLTELSAYVAPVQKRVSYTISVIGDKAALDAWKETRATEDKAWQAKRYDGAIRAFGEGASTKKFIPTNYQERYNADQDRQETLVSQNSITNANVSQDRDTFWSKFLHFIINS